MRKERISISLIIPHYQNMFSSFYTLEVIKEASRAAIDFDVDLLIETAWKAPAGDGILFYDMMGNEGWVKRARKAKIPYILLNYYDAASKDNCIGVNNEKAAFKAVNYLIKAGHRRIGLITGKLNAQAGRDRLEGYKRALKAGKIALDKRYVVIGDWTKDSGRQAMKELITLNKPPTAVFAAGDEMALGAMEQAKETGFKVPQDISFVGFDNIPEASLPGVCLTTIEQPFLDLAELGVKKIIQIIKKKTKEPVKAVLDNTKLIRRKSVKNLLK